MKAISLHQPFASLCVTRQPCGHLEHYQSCNCLGDSAECCRSTCPCHAGWPMVKRIETRSWRCPPALIGQPLAIHATKRWPVERVGEYEVEFEPYMHLPLGAVVGSGRVAACLPIVTADELLPDGWDTSQDALLVGKDGLWRDSQWEVDISDQLPYSDFTPGRFAWLIEDAAPATERCPWCWGKGKWYESGAVVLDTTPGYDPRVRCQVCDGAGRCDPIPARGRQRIWRWTP